LVISAGVEPPTVLRVDKESFTGTDIFISWYRKYFGRSITGSGLGGPDTNFIAVIKHQTIWATILKDCVVILILVELDASVEAGAVLWMAVVALPGALQDSLRVFPDALDLSLTVYDPHNPEGGDMETLCRCHGHKVLRCCQQVLLQTCHNQLPWLPLQICDDASNGVQ